MRNCVLGQCGRMGWQFRWLAGVMTVCAVSVWADEGSPLDVSVDTLRLEAGGFTDSPGASSALFAHAAVSARGDSGAWSYALGLRLDAHAQGGTRDFDRVRFDYGENYLRWNGDASSVTVGAQRIVWGRVDEISPIDRVGRNDFSRAVLDELSDRRLATPALRAEHFIDELKLDLVWVPVFDAAVMPDRDSVWHPVDTRTGRLLGIGEAPLIVGAQLRKEERGSGGAGLRVTQGGGDVDYGFSVQRVRQSQPYYRLDPGVLTAVHPYSWVLGGEAEALLVGATWRMEVAWSSDVPVTTRALQFRTVPQFDTVVGAEWFPGDGDTRVTLQVAARRLMTSASILDRKEIYNLTGEVEHPFGLGQWKAGLRFVLGMGDRDVYINPKISYVGFDQHELFVSGHFFTGSAQTLGGYYKDNDFVMLGWRASF